MKNRFRSVLWSSFWKTQGAIATLIGGGILGYIYWNSSPAATIPLAVALPVFVICISLIVLFAHAAYSTFQNAKGGLPKVLMGRSPGRLKNAKALCILESSELFSHNSVVSFYFVDGGYERFLGVGYVVNIQDNGYIQVELVSPSEGNEDVIDRLSRDEKAVLDKVLVKPNVPWDFLQIGD